MSGSAGEAIEKRRVLVLAYYFPPMGLSGVQRTAKFVKYLPRFGWKPTVLTCASRGYFAYDRTLLEEIEAAGVSVHRTSSLDPTRLFGPRAVVDLPEEQVRKAFSFLSQLFFVPDNKLGWWWPARRKALALLNDGAFDVIYSSAPPYTSHLVAAGLTRTTGVPLVLDFRDDWVGNPRHTYPTPLHRNLSARLERRALRAADRVVVINDVIRRNLTARNADMLSPDDVVVLPQGYDPDDFRVEPHGAGRPPNPEAFIMVYSGVFYDAQTPEPFLRALADVVMRRPDLKSRISAVFVGLLPDFANSLARELGINEVIQHTGYLPHTEAVSWLLAADVLWMIVGRQQGSESISTSKLYEYFGTRKPILGLVPAGAARDALKLYGAAEITNPGDVSAISAGIEHLYECWLHGRLPEPKSEFVDQFDRQRLSARLARLFDGVAGAVRPIRKQSGSAPRRT